MPKIDLYLYGPVEGQPGHSHIVGQPTAQEMFAQLEQHLNSIGYLPDDYFSLDRDWQNGVKIPADADIVCTADYGGSEGVYLNVALRWHDDAGNSHTKHFAEETSMSNCKVTAKCNQKGGVTKTTTTANLGVGLALQGESCITAYSPNALQGI